MTDEERQTLAYFLLMSWVLYGAIYMTRDAAGNITVHNPADLTITVNQPVP